MKAFDGRSTEMFVSPRMAFGDGLAAGLVRVDLLFRLCISALARICSNEFKTSSGQLSVSFRGSFCGFFHFVLPKLPKVLANVGVLPKSSHPLSFAG